MDGRRPTMSSLHGMVAAAHPLAAQAGARILSQGGNVFDAVGAVASALNVVEPFMSSLAGMGSAIMWVAAEQRVRVLDFVPPVPESFPLERFSQRSDLARGAGGRDLWRRRRSISPRPVYGERGAKHAAG